MAVEAHGAAGNRGILGELGLPEGIADDGGWGAAPGAIVGGGEDAARSGAGAEDVAPRTWKKSPLTKRPSAYRALPSATRLNE
jgi:hypothetical protein